MVRTFDYRPSHPKRALQVWQILISKATNRQTLTYIQLAHLLGFQGAGILAPILGHVMRYCKQHQLPPLTVLVVNQKSGLPGTGLTTPEDLHAEREQVFNFNWFKVYPPSPRELEASYKMDKKALNERIDALKTVPNANDYAEGFQTIDISNSQKALLIAQYHAPNQTVTVRELAEATQLVEEEIVNAYEKVAHQLSNTMKIKPVERLSQGQRWPILSIGYNGENVFYWQMRDEAILALEQLGWV